MIPENKSNHAFEIPEESPIHLMYKLAKNMTDDIFSELRKTNDPVQQIDIPIFMGSDMIITISRGAETAARIAIEKAKGS
jgi:Mg2+ and Co2+ transporter CorA